MTLILTLVFVLSIGSIALANPVPEQKTVEGQGDYFVTGEAFPTSIQMAGCNVRDAEIYLKKHTGTVLLCWQGWAMRIKSLSLLPRTSIPAIRYQLM